MLSCSSSHDQPRPTTSPCRLRSDDLVRFRLFSSSDYPTLSYQGVGCWRPGTPRAVFFLQSKLRIRPCFDAWQCSMVQRPLQANKPGVYTRPCKLRRIVWTRTISPRPHSSRCEGLTTPKSDTPGGTRLLRLDCASVGHTGTLSLLLVGLTAKQWWSHVGAIEGHGVEK
jgi:hypothetical protein